jgi:AraC-like DNA-binding protein
MGERAHGTHAKYAVEHCRCDDCRLAQRDYNRNRLRQLSRPDGVWCPYVDAGPARDHLAWLASCGVGLKTVARVGGLSHGTLSKLVYGEPARGMGPSKRIRPATAEKIMAVMPHQAAGAQRVPAGPTWRLLDELIARGWSRSELARRLGATTPALQVGRHRVRASTARAVEVLHAELVDIDVVPKKTRWGVRPTPVPNRLPVVTHRRARRIRAFPLAPLAVAAGMSESVLCEHFGLNLTRTRAGFDERQADELATRLGFHPVEVWGEAWLVSA